MFRKILSIITLGAFIATSTVPVVAADFNQYSLTQNNSLDHFGRSGGATVGAYLRIPFSDGLKHKDSRPSFGLAISKNRTGSYGDKYGFSSSNAPKLLDLSFGFSAQDSFRVNGMSLADMRALNADDDSEGGGLHPLIWVGIGAVGLLAVAALSYDGPFNSKHPFRDMDGSM